jgi:hypothetical protein
LNASEDRGLEQRTKQKKQAERGRNRRSESHSHYETRFLCLCRAANCRTGLRVFSGGIEASCAPSRPRTFGAPHLGVIKPPKRSCWVAAYLGKRVA